jgi:hypothetical protein
MSDFRVVSAQDAATKMDALHRHFWLDSAGQTDVRLASGVNTKRNSFGTSASGSRRIGAKKRGANAVIGWASLALASLLLGCVQPADLENPDDIQPLAGGGSVVPACVTAVLTNRGATGCANPACHSNTFASSGLNLSGNLEARLVDVPARHEDILGGTPPECPTGDKLIDRANPSNSWLLKKITGEHNGCGSPMPSNGSLTTDQKNCLVDWIMSYGPPGSAGGAGGTGGSGGGSGGSGGTGDTAGSGGTGGTGGTGGA